MTSWFNSFFLSCLYLLLSAFNFFPLLLFEDEFLIRCRRSHAKSVQLAELKSFNWEQWSEKHELCYDEFIKMLPDIRRIVSCKLVSKIRWSIVG